MKHIARILFMMYQWLITVPILAVVTIITATITLIGCAIGNRDFWGYWPAHVWARTVCILWFVRVKVVGRENIDPKTSYVFVANHQSAFDIWTIYGYLNHNFKWLMKKSLEKIPFVGDACKSAGHVFVDDSNPRGVRTTIEESEQRLRGGMSVVIFPEGSRTWDGRLGTFKRGAFMLAGEFKLPVVPLTISGAFERMPRTTYNAWPGKIVLTIHKPIYPGERGFNTRALLAQTREEIASALPEKYGEESAGESDEKKLG